jgi:biofilm PGA synthesis N-glycosyltransferase PgaC
MAWYRDLSSIIGSFPAMFAIGGIALVPGFMNAFLAVSLLLDRRPARRAPAHYPGLSILVAAYNEAASIGETLESIAKAGYPGDLEVIVIDDGSVDATADIAATHFCPRLRLLRQPRNLGKSAALNWGLAEARFDLIVTLDADSFLYRDALTRLVERYLSDPPSTRAVAGTVLVRNSRRNWVTGVQEWDYFHGIAAIKRVQSLYQGTLVAQVAFSIYDRAALRQYHSNTMDVGSAYFDPESYQQWLGVIGYRKRLSGWTTAGAIGAGQEFIRNGGTTTQPSYIVELRIEGPIAGNARLAVQEVYNRFAGFSNSPDYWWNLFSITLIVPF